MQTALETLFSRVKTIERNVKRNDLLIDFARSRPGAQNETALRLRRVTRREGTAGLQPNLDGSVLLICATFEQFVSDVVVAFCGRLPLQVPIYINLPLVIRRAHEIRTGEALAGRRGRFTDFERAVFVSNLDGCHRGQVPYTINGEALASTDRNLTSNQLRDLLQRLTVQQVWDKLSRVSALRNWSGRGWVRTRSLAIDELNRFMEERNQLAHTAGFAVVSSGDVLSYVKFIRALGKAVVTILTDRSLII